MKNKISDPSRRQFLKQTSVAGIGAALTLGISPSLIARDLNHSSMPAILG